MAAQNLLGLTSSILNINSKTPLSQNSIFGFTTPQTLRNYSCLVSNNINFNSPQFRPMIVPKLRPTSATVAFSLPTTTKPDVVEKLPKFYEKLDLNYSCLELYESRWSSRAIKAYAMSELEARKIRKPNTGTEALLMGILIEGTNTAAKFLRANGITLEKVREETFNLVGKPNKYFFSPEHPPLTEAAQRVIDRAFEEKIKSGEGGEVTTTDLLLSIWAETDSPGQKVLATLGFNDEKAKELRSLNSESAAKPSP